MIWTRQAPARDAGRSVLALSVLALLAFACFPLLAQADSSGIQYTDAPPTATGKHTIPTQSEPPAHSSKKSGGATAGNSGGSSEEGSSAGGSSSNNGGGSGTAKNAGNGQQGSSGSAPGGVGKAANPSQSAAVDGEPASSQSDSGSSPLVPILIAIAVLAAISIGAVIVRQRRRAAGGSVSPEAS
jgi:cobalamin biosynthesis Mg chelatase CobN